MNKTQSAGYLSNHLARLFALLLHNALKPLGVSPAYMPILLELWQADHLSQQDLVVRCDLSQATVANTLSRMERDGLIQRLPHPQDARSRIIQTTQKANNLRPKITKIAKKINTEALSVLSDDERTLFFSLITKVIEQQKKMLV